jgi:hypothetical protein
MMPKHQQRLSGGWLPLFLVSAACALGEGPTAAQNVHASFAGNPQVVFDTKTQACERDDIPDGPAAAFRDNNNTIHLIASHWVARAMVGPDLDHLRHPCKVIFRSAKNPNPGDFQNYSWLSNFYTADGQTVAAYVHNEYHAREIPGMCTVPRPRSVDCFWDSVAYAVSHDGGNSFVQPAPPGNLIATLPYQYPPDNRQQAGYEGPSNVVKSGPFYYLFINSFPYREQKYGACLLRTTDPFDPKSWRAWDGTAFTIQFLDPYRTAAVNPTQHVCPPVARQQLPTAGSIRYFPSARLFVAMQRAPDRRFGEPGFYINSSPDLIHWSSPVALTTEEAMLATEPLGRWNYLYPSLLDPASADRDFVTIGSRPYFYYVRLDRLHMPYTRTLMRRQIIVDVSP